AGAFQRSLETRRRNYQIYLTHLGILHRWGEPLEFDLDTDVPYQFVLFLKPGMKPLDFVRALLERSVPAVLGLALDPSVEKVLPADHPYKRIVAFPVHQDIRDEHIEHLASTLSQL